MHYYTASHRACFHFFSSCAEEGKKEDAKEEEGGGGNPTYDKNTRREKELSCLLGVRRLQLTIDLSFSFLLVDTLAAESTWWTEQHGEHRIRNHSYSPLVYHFCRWGLATRDTLSESLDSSSGKWGQWQSSLIPGLGGQSSGRICKHSGRNITFVRAEITFVSQSKARCDGHQLGTSSAIIHTLRKPTLKISG